MPSWEASIESSTPYNSPWNIAADFIIDLSLSEKEIGTMLEEYGKEKKISMDIADIAKRLRYYTSGHPFLVSKLCKIMNENLLEEKQEWNKTLFQLALQQILKEENTNFEHLIINLENNEKLYQEVYDLLIMGNTKFNIDNPVIHMGKMFGIFQEDDNGRLKIHNRIYEQRIYNYLSSLMESAPKIQDYNFKDQFMTEKGDLDMEKVRE